MFPQKRWFDCGRNKILKPLIVLIAILCLSTKMNAQDTLVNQFKYIHPVSDRKIITNDSLKVKTGYWIESDTMINVHQDVDGSQPGIINLSQTVFVAKGNYNEAGMKGGWWKYYDANGNLRKEVNYAFGSVFIFKEYYSDGKIRLEAVDSGTMHFKFYDRGGRIFKEGEIPKSLFEQFTGGE